MRSLYVVGQRML